MKIWHNFNAVEDFKRANKHRNCMKKCFECLEYWDNTGTRFVHLSKKEGKDIYFCDNCETKIKQNDGIRSL